MRLAAKAADPDGARDADRGPDPSTYVRGNPGLMQIIDVPATARISFAKPTADRPLEQAGEHFVVMDVATYDDMLARVAVAEAQLAAV